MAIEGHTDSTPFGRADYSNWELSADRANAARRILMESGLDESRISQVRGFADQRLLKKDDPTNPSNRRISIIVRNAGLDQQEEAAQGPLAAAPPRSPRACRRSEGWRGEEMISLKKFIESRPEESLKTMCESYRASLTAMGISATQICPHIGEDFQRDLLNSSRPAFAGGRSRTTVTETGKQVEEELKKWGEMRLRVFSADRPRRQRNHADRGGDRAGGRRTGPALRPPVWRVLGAIGGHRKSGRSDQDPLSPWARARTQLKSYVEKMVQDGEQSVSKLRAELSVYQSRLDEVERVATQDPVTGVANRYKAERQIQARIERGQQSFRRHFRFG